MGPPPHFARVEEVEVYPSNFSCRRRGRGGVEVRYSVYLFGPLPHFEDVVEVEVSPINFNWETVVEGGGGG